MRKIMIALVLGISALVLSVSAPCYARGHGHGNGHGYGHGSHVSFSGGVWVGPGWGAAWPGAFYPSYYPSYYPYYRYYTPRVIVQPRQEEYISQNPETEEQDYWYYCRKPEGYYPYITKCPGGWMKVVPPPEAPQGEE